MSGYVAIHRALFDHDMFVGQRFGQRDAWMWLIASAAWKPCRVRIQSGRASEMADLQRGQLTHSERFIAERWKWSRGAVRNFIRLLEKEEMISVNQTHIQAIITICNYEKFQNPEPQTSPTQAQHEPNISPKKKNLEEDIIKDIAPEAAPEDVVVTLHAFKGRLVKVNPDQYERWRKHYESIELRDELALADDYYFENPTKDGKWFFQVAAWLDRANKRARDVKKSELRARGDAW